MTVSDAEPKPFIENIVKISQRKFLGSKAFKLCRFVCQTANQPPTYVMIFTSLISVVIFGVFTVCDR